MTTKNITITDLAETIHELNSQTHWFNRVKAAERRCEICKHDRDYQAGDLLYLYEVEYGRRKRHFVERDAKGRFVNNWVDNEPLVMRITHVLPAAQCDGLVEGYCLLSIEAVGER